jgi:hypothetical protein
MDHAVDRVPRAGLIRLDVHGGNELLVFGMDEPVEVFPLGEQLVRREPDQFEAAR